VTASVTRSPGRPVGAKSEQTRADLVRSAREVFSRYGYHGTTLAQIAQQAGITRPAVHYHFPTKQALYQHVTEECYRTVVAPALAEAVKERTLAQQVSVFIDVGGRAIVGDRSAAAFLCSAAAECATRPDLLDPQDDPITTVREFLTSAVRAAEQRGELRADIEVEPLVELLVAMLCGVWAYVGFLGAEHGRAITSMTYQLLTGRLSLISQPSDGHTKP
jgi:AcrR family transcriptional regulator